MVRGEAAKAVQVIQPLTKTDAVPIVQTVSALRSVQIDNISRARLFY